MAAGGVSNADLLSHLFPLPLQVLADQGIGFLYRYWRNRASDYKAENTEPRSQTDGF